MESIFKANMYMWEGRLRRLSPLRERPDCSSLSSPVKVRQNKTSPAVSNLVAKSPPTLKRLF
jgi:hypothetical protein